MASRFLRKSVRRQIRDFDNFQNVYPNLRRSSDQTNLTFNNQSPFDDTKSIRFGFDGISFPSMTPVGYNNLPSSSIFLPSASLQTIIITPPFPFPPFPVTVLKGTVLSNISPTSQEYLPNLSGNSQSLPFDDARVSIPGTEDYIATSSVYRIGFKSATRNKIAIPIDISTNDTKTLFKLSQYDTALDPDGPFYGSGSTGFVYYNFQNKRWEDIGLTDQYRGHLGDITDAPAISTSIYVTSSYLTASDYYMSQFRSSDNAYHQIGSQFVGQAFSTRAELTQEELDYYDSLGYGGIGTPSWFFDAPRAPRYHATASQTFSLKNYIRQPFILEEIEVSIPISSTRKLGGSGGSDPAFPSTTQDYAAQGGNRDIDNLNFFIYRQNGNDPNLSKRKLITYESAAFYSSYIGSERLITANIVVQYNTMFLPESVVKLHNPISIGNYNTSSLYPITANTTTTINKVLNFKTTPKNSAPQISPFTTNNQYFYTISGSYTSVREETNLYFVRTLGWNGPDSEYFLNNKLPIRNISIAGTDILYAVRNEDPTGTKNTPGVDYLSADPRFIYKTAVYSSSSLRSGSPVFNKPGRSPYILFPDDDLIFGFETGVSPVTGSDTAKQWQAGNDSSYLSVTSSFHQIISGPARITLYGSLIQNGEEKPFNSLNQNLISANIHETIFDPAQDSDQFLISERRFYTGSYLDNFMTGSIFSRTRYVSSSLTAENSSVGARGSFERFVGLSSPEEVYYDCLTTDGRTISSETEIFKYSPQFDLFAPSESSAGNYYFQTDGNLRPNYPYKSGKVRQLNTPKFGISALNTFYSGKDFKTAFFYTGKNQYSNFPYEIRSFASSSLPSSNYVAYGMLNVENQQPKAVFRPDKYGQFRDMLEQPFDAATFRIVGIVGPTEPPVVVKFVSASSEEVIPPQFTNSNNLSVYYTSSLPYFDGENRSRPSTFITSSNGQFVPTTIIFQT